MLGWVRACGCVLTLSQSPLRICLRQRDCTLAATVTVTVSVSVVWARLSGEQWGLLASVRFLLHSVNRLTLRQLDSLVQQGRDLDGQGTIPREGTRPKRNMRTTTQTQTPQQRQHNTPNQATSAEDGEQTNV